MRMTQPRDILSTLVRGMGVCRPGYSCSLGLEECISDRISSKAKAARYKFNPSASRLLLFFPLLYHNSHVFACSVAHIYTQTHTHTHTHTLTHTHTHSHTHTHTHTLTLTHTHILSQKRPRAQWVIKPKSPSIAYFCGMCGIQHSTTSMSCFNTTPYSGSSSLWSWLSSPPELRVSSLCCWLSYLHICLLGRILKPHSAKFSRSRFSELPL
jgi:hypothetical protein